MDTILIVLFGITYVAIAFEHPLKINKSASALLGGSLMWAWVFGKRWLVGDILHRGKPIEA
jgi:hypothetical protein